MMAIPRAYYLLGALLGTAMLVAVACLTYWTKAVLVDGSAATGRSSYASLAWVTCGRGAALAVQLAVWAFCFGFMIIYLVVIGAWTYCGFESVFCVCCLCLYISAASN